MTDTAAFPSNMVEHARRELTRIGEEPETIDWYCRVIEEFASYGHSGGSASVAIPTLNRLLLREALTPITSDPAEWYDQSHTCGTPLWQNTRDSRAMSEDGGETYWLVDEAGEGHPDTTPVHRSADPT